MCQDNPNIYLFSSNRYCNITNWISSFMFKHNSGIEAEAVMLGQPISMVMPEVVGCHLKGALSSWATSTDLVLTITQVCSKSQAV